MTLVVSAPEPTHDAIAAAQNVPYHVETWAGYKYGGTNEGHNSPPATSRRWVSYLESPTASAVYDICNTRDHPCQSVLYVDNTMQYFGKCGYSDAVVNGQLKQRGTLPESAWLHKSSNLEYANRIFYLYNPTKCVAAADDTGLILNHKSGEAFGWMNTYYQRRVGNSVPDYYLNDDIRLVNKFNGASAYEYDNWIDLQNTEAAWLARQTDRNGRTQKVFFNGCDRNPYVAPAVTLVKMRPNIIGCENEDGVNAKDISNGRDLYMLDNCARVSLNPNGGIFLNGPDEEGTASSPNVKARRQATAFNWLCYVPRRVIFWEEEEWGGQYVNVFPEAGVYMSDPLQSMQMPTGCPDATISKSGAGNTGTSGDPCTVHGHNDLAVPTTANVFRREFARCYERGVAFGRCAVIWNMSGARVTVQSNWLRQRYAHTMTMNSGRNGHGTIDDGGTLTLTTPIAPVGASIPAYDALFLVE